MTTISTFIDSILPEYGSRRINLPVWNEGDCMYISCEYESEAGHRYYKGLRFSNRLAVVETIGLYYTWKYIDAIEVYAFNGKEKVLIGSRQYDKTFYDKGLIRNAVNTIVQQYISGQMKLRKVTFNSDTIAADAEGLVDDSYKSFLDDDYDARFEALLPVLGADK